MKENKIKTADNGMISGVIWKQILRFFFPIMIGTFFQQLYNTVDAVIVGRFVGKAALSSVGGSSAQIIYIVLGFFTGLATGGTVQISRYFGAGESKRLDDALHTTYTFGLLGGVVCGVLGFIAAPWLLELMNTPAECMTMSTTYVRIYFSGMVFVVIYNIGSAILRAVGDSKRPLYFLIVCCMVNIILDLVLVLAFRMGVTGVAIATTLSQAVSALLITYTLMKKTDCMTLSFKKLSLDKSILIQTLKIGLPTGIQSSMYDISNMTVQSSVNMFGVTSMAAWTSHNKISSFFWLICNSFVLSTTTFVGQNYGAGMWKRVRRGTFVCLAMAVGASVTLAVANYFWGNYVLMIFNKETDVVNIGFTLLRTIVPFHFLYSVTEILAASLRAQGRVLFPTMTSLLGICVFRVIWVKLLTPGQTLRDIVICYPYSWIITGSIGIVYYLIKQRKIIKEKQTDQNL